MSRKYKVKLMAAALVSVIVIAAAITAGFNYYSTSQYFAVIEEADALYESGDYNAAILKYYEAIQEKPDKEDGYLGIALAYHMAGRDDYAVQMLMKGLEIMPDNEKLLAMYREYGGSKGDISEIRMDDSVLESLAGMTYYDYGKKKSIESTKSGANNSYWVRVKGVGATLIYRNTSQQPNAIGPNNPNPDSTPAEVSFDNIMAMFGGGSAATLEDLKKLKVENLQIVEDAELGTSVSFTYGVYRFLIASDKDGNIKENAQNIVYLPRGAVTASGTVAVRGAVTDAVSGDSISSVSIVFSGRGTKTEVTTDKNGEYEAVLDRGDYTAEIRASGYVDETKSIYVPSNAESWSCDFVISPELENNEARIVLTWGSTPSDLDSHLIWSGGHVWFADESCREADLDIDDRDGYGPETTTIHDLSGSYTFVVHDFTESGNIGSSGATVTVYLPGEEPQIIDISGGGSDTWVVFSLDNGKLNIINEVRDYDLGLDF